MSINDHGFLGHEIEDYKAHIQKTFGEHLDYYTRLNVFLNKLKFALRPKQDDVRRITIVTLFVKGLETFQSIYILSSHGLTIDAEVLNRALFEAVGTILYCSASDENCKRYHAQDLHNKLKLINIVRQDPKRYLFGKPSEELDKVALQWKQMLAELGNPKPITIEGMIRQTAVRDLYDPFYRLASRSVHTSPHSLQKYILEKHGKVRVVWGPRDEGIEVQLVAAVEFMLIACECLSEVFGVPKQEETGAFNQEKARIWPIEGKEKKA
jgi:hypothetical protein